MALCEPAATELKSKKTLTDRTDFFRSLFTDPFFDLFLFDLYFDFLLILIVP